MWGRLPKLYCTMKRPLWRFPGSTGEWLRAELQTAVEAGRTELLSTILNALKKLESDSSAGADLPQAQVRRRTKQSGQPGARVILFAFFVALCLAAAAGFYSQFHSRRDIAVPSGSSRTAAEASRKSASAGAAGTTGRQESGKASGIIPASPSAEKKKEKPRASRSANEPAATEQIKSPSDTKPEPARPRKEKAVDAAGGRRKASNAYP